MDWLSKVKEAGVVGAGGAGFPTHIKLNTQQSLLIVNGIECEPLLETDKYLMRTHADLLVKATEFVKNQIGACRAVIGIKDKNTKEIRALQEALKKVNSTIELKIIQNYYPAGDEHILVQEVMGRSIPPGGIPLDVGAVVTNVATLLDVENALQNIPVTYRVITVSGAVNSPKLLRVPVGTSVMECLEQAGGVSIANYKVILGGPIMGTVCDPDQASITKTTNGLVVIEADSYLMNMKLLPMNHIVRRTESACIQCQMCTDLCPRYLNGHPIYPHRVMRAIGNHESDIEALKSALLCCECGVCELYACPMGLSPKTVNQHVKVELLSHGIRYKKDAEALCEPHEMMPYRKIHTSRIMARTEILKYEGIHLDELFDYTPKRVLIPLKQHVGTAAKAVIENGAIVTPGMCIARMEDGMLGANIHASISGKATVLDFAIQIDAQEVHHD